jgi:MFS family permease
MEQADTQTLAQQESTWNRLITTAFAHMTEHLYVGIITVVLPVMATSLGLNMAQAGLLVSARSLVAGLSNVPSGLLADMANKRSLLLGLSLIVVGLSSFLMSFAPDFWTLLALMAFGAVGAGSFHPQSLAILSASYRDRRALALGVHDSSGNLGEVLAPLTIGTLLTYMDWRSTLQIWAVPGLTVGLLYALFCAETNGSPLPRERFGRSLWRDVLTNRTVLGMLLISVFRTMGQTALLAFLPLYLTLELKLSVGTMGMYISTLFLFAGIAPSFSGWVSDRVGRAPMIIAGSLASAIAIAVVPFLSPGISLVVGCAAVGTMLWALRPVVFAAAMEVTPPQLAGSLVGFLFTGNMGLSFVAPIAIGFVADAYGLTMALALIGTFPLMACVITLSPLLAPEKRPSV